MPEPSKTLTGQTAPGDRRIERHRPGDRAGSGPGRGRRDVHARQNRAGADATAAVDRRLWAAGPKCCWPIWPTPPRTTAGRRGLGLAGSARHPGQQCRRRRADRRGRGLAVRGKTPNGCGRSTSRERSVSRDCWASGCEQRGSGAIVNMGWDQAEHGMAGASGEIFAATKGAVMAFSKSLARSLAPAVRVNCVAPGWIKTAWGQHASQAWQDRAKRESLLGRWGTPDDVAHAVVFLASPAASFITGHILPVNGGLAMPGNGQALLGTRRATPSWPLRPPFEDPWKHRPRPKHDHSRQQCDRHRKRDGEPDNCRGGGDRDRQRPRVEHEWCSVGLGRPYQDCSTAAGVAAFAVGIKWQVKTQPAINSEIPSHAARAHPFYYRTPGGIRPTGRARAVGGRDRLWLHGRSAADHGGGA